MPVPAATRYSNVSAHIAPSPAAARVSTWASSLYLRAASTIPSSPSSSTRCHGFHAIGDGAARVGRQPSRQYSLAVREATATLAGDVASHCIALSTSVTSAAAAYA